VVSTLTVQGKLTQTKHQSLTFRTDLETCNDWSITEFAGAPRRFQGSPGGHAGTGKEVLSLQKLSVNAKSSIDMS
jgi:hypothetical protein